MLSINNVINISVSAPPSGLAEYQINNLAIFTKETPLPSSDSFDYRAYTTPVDVAADWGTSSEVYEMAQLIFAQSPNILSGDGQLLIFPQGVGETLEEAITRGEPLAFFGGVLFAGYAPSAQELYDASVAVQSLRKLLFVSDHLVTSVEDGGAIKNITSANLTNARCLLYTTGALEARLFAAAYASRLMSTDFEGSNTTQTMHMKDLAGILPDEGITQTVANTCKSVGADFCTTIQTLTKVFSTGGNEFSDDVYNLLWLAFTLEVRGFNAIATTSTKLPQTEPGMAVLKNAYIEGLTQAVRNGFLAPGSWTSSDLFGNPEDLKANVLAQGWYIYSQPVAQQSKAAREAREAPLVQIAVKYAGAIHSSDVIVYVNR